MSLPLGPYDTNDYDFVDDGDNILFTLELNSTPALHILIEVTPLSGPVVTYKVEAITWVVQEMNYTPPTPPGGSSVQAHKPRGKIVVSVVP